MKPRGDTIWQVYRAKMTPNRPLLLLGAGGGYSGGGCHPGCSAVTRGWHYSEKVTKVRVLPSDLNS